MDSDEIRKLKADVLTVFHRVSTYIPGNGSISGAFIVAKNENELFFWWRDYPEPKSYLSADKNDKAKFSIILRTNNIQKIMVNHQQDERYILISTIQPANMHQFLFPRGSSNQLLSFAQILSLFQNFKQNTNQKKNENKTLETAVNFIASSFSSTESKCHLYEFEIEQNQISIPIDFSIAGLLPQSVVYVKPDLHIISQFKIVSDDYTKNPITEKEIDTFQTFEELKSAIMNRGLEPSVRSIVWPVIFGIIPFDKSKREIILKKRIDEYISIRKQWQTMSKMQLKYNLPVRNAFSTIRSDVRRTHFPDVILQSEKEKQKEEEDNENNNQNEEEEAKGDSSYWSDILTNILRSFTMWNLNVRYTQGLNDFVVNFMTVFHKMYQEDREKAEALTFWCFASFIELNSSGLIDENLMDKQNHELPKIFEVIEKFHPACAKWLRVNNLNDLSFLISSFMLAYGRSFSYESVSRIWETLICVPEPGLFLRYFSASLVILSYPSFQQISNCSTGKLVSIIDSIFYNQEIGALIGVSLKIMDASIADEKHEILTSEEKKTSVPTFKSGSVVLFKPVTTYTSAYESIESLFS